MDKVKTNSQPVLSSAALMGTSDLQSFLYSTTQTSDFDLIVFCHLRWEFVFQRPQHLLSRMSQSRKILFVEEPVPFAEGEEGSVRIYQANDNITVLQPRLKWESYLTEIVPIVQRYAKNLGLHNPGIWLYSANFYPLLAEIDHSIVIYDCMDELSAFQGANKSLLGFEKKLIEEADVVFTGGKSLYESKKKITDKVHCFPSSVDRKHFEQALKAETSVPADIQNISGPIVGFYGVIDERMDLKLLKKVAQSLPKVHFVVIGPVVKIDPATLPKLSNIHYLGQKSYEELPHYLKAIDVAMMPFALNKATKFISPTKTLEFMAALKPIVSTPIYDVKRDYEHVVSIANSSDQFAAAIADYLVESEAEQQARIAKEKKIIEKTSWDKTAKKMTALMTDCFKERSIKSQRRNEIAGTTTSVAFSL